MKRQVKNISLTAFRKFLELRGCKMIRTKGGHEVWSHRNCNRPIVIQSHIDPIPTFIVLNNLRTLGISKEDFLKDIENI
jgi:predicted RNA binding protein YcfA (HicA-like mRNA interferase family)